MMPDTEVQHCGRKYSFVALISRFTIEWFWYKYFANTMELGTWHFKWVSMVVIDMDWIIWLVQYGEGGGLGLMCDAALLSEWGMDFFWKILKTSEREGYYVATFG